MAWFVPVAAGVGLVWGLVKLFSGPSSATPEPKPDPEPYTPPPDKTPDGSPPLIKVSPDNPEGTIADYNEGVSKGRNAVDRAIYDESQAVDAGETGYCSSYLGCVGNIAHVTPDMKKMTNQGRLGFSAGVAARAAELGLVVSEDGDLSY